MLMLVLASGADVVQLVFVRLSHVKSK
jgi:hypothetical protein